jgi:hypothetical protein
VTNSPPCMIVFDLGLVTFSILSNFELVHLLPILQSVHVFVPFDQPS